MRRGSASLRRNARFAKQLPMTKRPAAQPDPDAVLSSERGRVEPGRARHRANLDATAAGGAALENLLYAATECVLEDVVRHLDLS